MLDGGMWDAGSQVVTFLSIHTWLFSMGNQILISPQSGEGGLSRNTGEMHMSSSERDQGIPALCRHAVQGLNKIRLI